MASGIPARWQLAILSMFGLICLYALRFNISQALVAMTGNVTYCHNKTPTSPEFNWTAQSQGLLQSSFFYGYAAMSLPGGWVCGVFGSKRVIAVAMLANAILCLLTPLVATTGVVYLIALRILQGMFQAPVFPGMHRMWGKWAPQADVGTLSSVSYSGPYIGNILSYSLGGFLSERGFGAHAGQTYCGANWPSVFYVFGTISLVWLVFWYFMAYDSPTQHPWISPSECVYITQNLAHATVDSKNQMDDQPYSCMDLFPFTACVPQRYVVNCRIPWRAILTSGPIWALIFSVLTFDYGMYMMMTNVPTFLNEVLGFDISSSGFYSSLPFLMMWFMTLVGGGLTALDIVKRNMSFTIQRKAFTFFGSVLPAVFLIAVGYCKTKALVVMCLTLAAGFSGLQIVGSGINQIDLAPRYADILMGFSNTFAAMGGIIAPYVTSILTTNKTAEEWQLVFNITSVIFVLGAGVFVKFGSGKKQWWADGVNNSRHHREDDDSGGVLRIQESVYSTSNNENVFPLADRDQVNSGQYSYV